MAPTIEVFYSFQSPFSYLALESIYNLQSKYDIQLLWQPFSAKASGQAIQPTSIAPEKLTYVYEDCKRFAAENRTPLTFPESWPEVEYDPERVTRGAVIANDLDMLMEYNFKVFHRWWGEGQNPNDEDFMSELCDELDTDLGDFLSKMSSSDTRERVRGIFKRGKKLGVFDTPTFILEGGERVVGLDKIPYLDTRLEREGLRKAA